MDFLYNNYDTTIVLAFLGAIVLAIIVLAVVFYVYYRARDETEERE